MNSGFPLFVISQTQFWFVFAFCLALFAIASLILFYHWWRYRFGNTGVIAAGTIYLAVSALLIAMAFTALI